MDLCIHQHDEDATGRMWATKVPLKDVRSAAVTFEEGTPSSG